MAFASYFLLLPGVHYYIFLPYNLSLCLFALLSPHQVSRILEDPLRPDVNEKNAAGSTALHDASYHGYNGLVVQLLQAGADVEIKDATGCTPLQRACAGNRPATIYILIVQVSERDVHLIGLLTTGSDGL